MKLCKIEKDCLREALKSSGLTQKELAEKVGRNFQAFSKAINGNGLPFHVVDDMGKVLDRDPRYIMGEYKEHPELFHDAPIKYATYGAANIKEMPLIRDYLTLCGYSMDDLDPQDIELLSDGFRRVISVICEKEKFSNLPDDHPYFRICRVKKDEWSI